MTIVHSGWLACVLVLAPTGAAQPVAPGPVAPEEPPVAAVPPGIEVLRISRDFGKPHFSLAIDAWLDGERLDDARLWWVNTGEQDRRKPLGKLIERLVKLQYRRVSGTTLSVVVAGDGKEFTFTVELGQDGSVGAYVPVDTEAGAYVPRCRAESARLLARRALGLPVGIARISVTCRDDGGAVHSGQVRHRDV